MEKTGFIITYYNNSPQAENYLEELLDSISVCGYYVVLVSHSPVKPEIQELCDFFIYQDKDVADNRRWSHGVAENNSIQFGLKHLKEIGIRWTYKMCYDVSLKDLSVLSEWRKNNEFNLVTSSWGEVPISTHSFYANVDWLLVNIEWYNSIEGMFETNNVLEICWFKSLIKNGVYNQVFIYPTKEEMFGPENKIDLVANNYRIEFIFDESEEKFHVRNYGEEIKGVLIVYDYYTDLPIIINMEYHQPEMSNFWNIQGKDTSGKSLNGFYCEITLENGFTIRKNFGVKDFDNKHHKSKWYRKRRKEYTFLDFITGSI